MPANHPTFAHSRPVEAQSTAGLLLGLCAALPAPEGRLAHRARRLAHRLADGTSTPADRDSAAALLARLLDATDTGLPGFDADLLDEDFDA